MIAVVDYEAGNLKSVETALEKLGADFFISSDPLRLAEADKMIFPGVGEAAQAMAVLKKTGLDLVLKEFALTGKPLLGICLGSQILFDSSEESDTPCLGILPGKVCRFSTEMGLKIPHMGWNTLTHSDHPLFLNLPQDKSFYFVHSYYVEPQNKADIIGSSDYGHSFTAAVARKNVMATQFHPEKSGEWGLLILQNFIDL
ncbi:imidazole glycerol phosphate synthase subunit HisH [Oceanispirochaeta sp.]|jgi:glutamine amidotransferase|uniref:imidazole glycerol phosphate synthase subunit HisH n=1 Tax=Oceanispirochaeta sp. TaxID=2035350 RepID=UPI002628DBD7|nr:imidazole glycerol phosphate synthase subunit HisH [Oceanispirochaeta sp.]MDA3955232.1 imidazole glycerol phosphate synthase subunit HisH [Oceanispirochaeta sp.]